MLSFHVDPSGDGLLLQEESQERCRRRFFGARDLFGAIRVRAADRGTNQVTVSWRGELSARQQHEVAALLHLLRESGFRVIRDL
jgi:hypothetical protein